MCDFILKKKKKFLSKGIVFLLGIPHMIHVNGVIRIITFSNLIIFIIQSCTAFNKTVCNNFSFWQQVVMHSN